MDETRDPTHDSPVPASRPVVSGIPLARPITVPCPSDVGLPRDELLLPASTRGAAWVDVAVVLLLMLSLELFMGTLIAAVVGSPDGPQDLDSDAAEAALAQALLVPVLLVRAVGSILIIAVILRHRSQSVKSVGFRRGKLALNVLIGFGAVAVAFGLNMAASLLLWFVWPELPDQMMENARRIVDMVPKLHPLGFAGVAIMIGVYEELLFRGFLMTRLRRASGSWVAAVLISTAIFTALHALDQTPAALVPITILSLVFSIATIWRRSIVPAIVAHTLWNFCQFLYLYTVPEDVWT